jgi:protein-L-isoaspartate(D-aspartate) O-methyltransferase
MDKPLAQPPAMPIVQTSSAGEYFAELVCSRVGVSDAAVPRERFLGPGPWLVASGPGCYIRTPSADLAFIYGDVVVGLIPERMLNNGEPSFHANCLRAAAIQPGDTVVHVGAGVGYYSAIMAELAGSEGSVHAVEIDPGLAARAEDALAPWPQAKVHARSGLEAPFPEADVIYVNAGVSGLAPAWLDAIRPGGRMIVPLTTGWKGAMMLFTCRTSQMFEARAISPTAIIPCVGGQDEVMAQRLIKALEGPGGAQAFNPFALPPVSSLWRGTAPDHSCWLEGEGWWLSTEPLPPDNPN